MISDIHNNQKLLELPESDLLIVAGDMTNMGTYDELTNFTQFLSAQKSKFGAIVVIPGNHELTIDASFFNQKGHLYFPPNILDSQKARAILTQNPDFIYLEDSGFVYKGVRIWGTPWICPFGEWAFMLPSPEFARNVFSKIPMETDILISHSPPFGIMDRVVRYEYKEDPRTKEMLRTMGYENTGSKELLERVRIVKPKLHVFGHIHECSGAELHDDCLFVNAAILDHQHLPRNLPKRVVLKFDTLKM